MSSCHHEKILSQNDHSFHCVCVCVSTHTHAQITIILGQEFLDNKKLITLLLQHESGCYATKQNHFYSPNSLSSKYTILILFYTLKSIV